MTTPTREELLKLAKEAGAFEGFGDDKGNDDFVFSELALERFAALLSAHQAQGEPEPAFWYDPASVERRRMYGAVDQVVITGASSKWGHSTTPLYAAPPSSAQTDQASPAAQSGAVDSQPLLATDELRDSVRDSIAEALGEAYDCTRVWSAWGVGTMGPDDFVLVAEDDGRVYEIADAAIAALSRAQTAPAVSLSSVDLASDERALLQKAAQVISWHSFGECRAFGDGPIPEPSEVVGQIKEVLSRTAPAPVSEQPAAQTAGVLDYERWRAIMESERNAACEEYFKARISIDTDSTRKSFEAGFERGFAAAPQPVAEQVGEQQEFNIETAAKKLSECMDYPWDHMPEQGRQSMRAITQRVLAAAHPQAAQAKGGDK